MIEVNQVTKYYGNTKAVDDVSFTVDKGEIVGFLGPNGAGKTTTMRMITGFLYPDKGNIKVAGYDIMDQGIDARRHIGYLPENVPLYHEMYVKDYFDFVADIKGVKKENKKSHISEITGKVGLTEVRNKLISKLSKGFRQRVGIGEALIGNPDILIMDEPTIGLDPNQIIEIRNLIRELGKEKTIILSSHILQEVSALCTRVIIIHEGKLVAIDTKEELMKNLESGQRIKILVDNDFNVIKNKIGEIVGIKMIELMKTENSLNEIIVTAQKDKDIRNDLARKVIESGFNLFELSPITMSLEDVFIKLTREEV
ncbi:MAG: ATP-binding cassette domain-containing protein [bacterium]|nr:ATP-binding cassette domain-containing protein [bacterium]